MDWLVHGGLGAALVRVLSFTKPAELKICKPYLTTAHGLPLERRVCLHVFQDGSYRCWKVQPEPELPLA